MEEKKKESGLCITGIPALSIIGLAIYGGYKLSRFGFEKFSNTKVFSTIKEKLNKKSK